MPSGFDLIVDYGASHQVCKLRVPALMSTDEPVRRASEMKQRMDDFLEELVPGSMRGKELIRLVEQMGVISLVSVEYEHVTIHEIEDANQPLKGTITVRFKNADCQDLSGE